MQLALKGVTNNLLLLSSGDVYKAYDTFHTNLSDVDNSPLKENSELRSRFYPYKPEQADYMMSYYSIMTKSLLKPNLKLTDIEQSLEQRLFD